MTVRNLVWSENIECKKLYILHNPPKKATKHRCEVYALYLFVQNFSKQTKLRIVIKFFALVCAFTNGKQKTLHEESKYYWLFSINVLPRWG